MSNKLLGLFGVIGGAGLTAVEIRHLVQGTILNGSSIDSTDEFGYVIWGLGFMFAFWGIFRLGVTGNKIWMRWAPLVSAIGFAGMAIGSLLDITGLTNPRTNPILLVAAVFLVVGLLLTSILTLVSRKWAGWRKFAPVIVIVALVLSALLGSLTNEVSSVLFGLSWVVLGFAVLTSEPTFILQDARA